MISFSIPPLDKSILPSIIHKIDSLCKPKGSLGRLEEIATQICLIQQSLCPCIKFPHHLLFGSDHGVEREHVSATPREVTWQQMINFSKGGGGVNVFCKQHGFTLRIIDIGVDYDFDASLKVVNRKIDYGTSDFLYGSAMDENQFNEAIKVGYDEVDLCINGGATVISIGEMGVANTSSSAIWMSLLCDIPLKECIGVGSGLYDDALEHKRSVLCKAVNTFKSFLQTTENFTKSISYKDIMQYFGGFEMVASVGAMLRAAERNVVILIDGFIMTACALAAICLYPASKERMIFCHCGAEAGHRRMLDALQVKPILDLDMRLGEGVGALCAYPIVESAVKMINEMSTFDGGNITKYF